MSKNLTKISDNFTVNMYDNGYMVEATGRDEDSNWVTTKYICKTEEELMNHIKALTLIERDD